MSSIFDTIPPELLAGGGFASLTIAAFWFVFTGRLVPGRVYAEMRDDRDAWRKVAEARAAENQVTGRQLERVLEQGETVERVVRSLQALVQQAQQAQGGR